MPIDPRPIQDEPKGFTNPTVPDTLISVIIAFALAFIGRAYVLEPFVIPTGSMAPTLLGAHFRADVRRVWRRVAHRSAAHGLKATARSSETLTQQVSSKPARLRQRSR